FERFGQYLDHIRTIPGVRFVTARDLPTIYPDPVRSGGVSSSDLDELARGLASPDLMGINFQVISGRAYSPADQFVLLAAYLSAQIRGKPMSFPMSVPSLLGPDSPAPTIKDDTPTEIPWYAFRDAMADVQD